MKTFTAICLRLTEAEGKLVERLNKKGITQIEIFRQGLALCERAEFRQIKPLKKVIEKAKGVING